MHLRAEFSEGTGPVTASGKALIAKALSAAGIATSDAEPGEGNHTAAGKGIHPATEAKGNAASPS